MAAGELSLALRALNEWWAEAGLDLAEARAVAALQEGERKAAPPPASGKREPPTPQALAARAGDLSALRAAVEAFDGCALRATARSTVFLEGPDHAPVMLVGERPGREEDALGRPFVGRSGALLERMLAAIGLAREELLLANVVFWRPPGDRTPTQSEVALCLPFLERAIALVRPKALLLCGGLAAQSLLRTEEGPLRLRAREHSYPHTDGFSVHAMVMLHPAYLLRRPQEKRLAWADLLRLESRLDALGIARRPRL